LEVVEDKDMQKKLGTTGVSLFLLAHSTRPHYYLSAKTEEEMVPWVQCLLVEIQRESVLPLYLASEEKEEREGERGIEEDFEGELEESEGGCDDSALPTRECVVPASETGTKRFGVKFRKRRRLKEISKQMSGREGNSNNNSPPSSSTKLQLFTSSPLPLSRSMSFPEGLSEYKQESPKPLRFSPDSPSPRDPAMFEGTGKDSEREREMYAQFRARNARRMTRREVYRKSSNPMMEALSFFAHCEMVIGSIYDEIEGEPANPANAKFYGKWRLPFLVVRTIS